MAADETEKKSTTREYYEALLIAVIFVNFARIFVFQAFKIPTGSMEDNLKIGGHIIVFRYPLQPDTDFVKRVIGLPGDTVEVRDKVVYINGKALDEPYVIHDDPMLFRARGTGEPPLPEPYRSRDQYGPYAVAANSYFAMGDNGDRSSDSRYWGTVPRSMIKGRAFMVYWSFRGTPPPPEAPSIERVKELGRVVYRFFPDTRWSRMFFIVDSKYHFTPERSPGEPGEMP